MPKLSKMLLERIHYFKLLLSLTLFFAIKTVFESFTRSINIKVA